MITPIIGAQIQNLSFTKDLFAHSCEPMPLTFVCDVFSAGYHQRRKSNTKTRHFCPFFEVWKLQSLFIVIAGKRATRTFLNLTLFVFPWRTKNKAKKKSDGLDMRYGSFKLIKGVQAFQPTVWIAVATKS